jgi:hypothetical protein
MAIRLRVPLTTYRLAPPPSVTTVRARLLCVSLPYWLFLYSCSVPGEIPLHPQCTP